MFDHARLVAPLTLVALCLWGCGEDEPQGGAPDVGQTVGAACSFDDSEGPETALALPPGAPQTGSLCPVEDQDWYALEVPAGHRLAQVTLSMDAPLSPVEPTYIIRDAAGAVVATPPSTSGGALSASHCLAPGLHHLVVRDQGDDGEDRRSVYQLTLDTAPDPDGAEPNDAEGEAAAVTLGAARTGYIACVGDVDWHRVEIGDGEVLRFDLEMPAGGIQPQVRVLNAAGVALYEQRNAAGGREATSMSRSVAVGAAGAYFVVVEDDDGADADPRTAYTLTISATAQLDLNEPNDRAEEATELEGLTCGDGWTSWQTLQGTLGAVGDPDWFRIGAEGCGGGLIEAEVRLNTDGLGAAAAAELERDVQLSLALVRGHGPSECQADEECRELNRSCDDSWGCAGFFNTCMPSGKCAGATACLKEGVCGAFVTERHYDPTADPEARGPTAHEVRLSAPIFLDAPVYLRVSEFGGEGQAPNTFYELRVRTRTETDLNEPSNVYVPTLTQGDDLSVQRRFAQEQNMVVVHDCAGPVEAPDAGIDAAVVDAGAPDAADAGPPEPVYIVPGCCGPNDWIEGALSYEADQDWYAYAHPCPGEDCMVRIKIQVDSGAVDQLWQIFQGNSRWFNGLVPVEERDSNPEFDGAFGGLEAGDSCFYAYQGHGDGGLRYSVAIRDLLPRADWSPDQRYRFCIEKAAHVCVAPPCAISANGECDAP